VGTATAAVETSAATVPATASTMSASGENGGYCR
jgi:hypothetical protein